MIGILFFIRDFLIRVLISIIIIFIAEILTIIFRGSEEIEKFGCDLNLFGCGALLCLLANLAFIQTRLPKTPKVFLIVVLFVIINFLVYLINWHVSKKIGNIDGIEQLLELKGNKNRIGAARLSFFLGGVPPIAIIAFLSYIN